MSKSVKQVVNTKSIALGKIGSPYSISGWIRVFSFTENKESIFNYQPWRIEKAHQRFFVELSDWKRHSKSLIIKIKGINNRDAASTLTHFKITVNLSELPSLEESDYYWQDLIGCQVVTIAGYRLGKVIHMMETGSNDVMVLKSCLQDTFGIKERLVPFLHGQVIKKVDLISRVIKIDWDPSF